MTRHTSTPGLILGIAIVAIAVAWFYWKTNGR